VNFGVQTAIAVRAPFIDRQRPNPTALRTLDHNVSIDLWQSLQWQCHVVFHVISIWGEISRAGRCRPDAYGDDDGGAVDLSANPSGICDRVAPVMRGDPRRCPADLS